MTRTSMTNWTLRGLAGLALLSAPGCGGTDPVGGGSTGGSSGDVDPWWDTTGDDTVPATTSASASSSASASASASAGSDSTGPGDSSGGEEESESGEPLEDEIGIFGWATVEPGVSFTGMDGEFIAFVGGEEVCVIYWDFQSGTPNDTCTECDFAFDIVRNEPTVEIDENCAEYIDPAMLPTMVSLGYTADEVLMMHDGNEWIEAGFAEYLPNEGNEFAWFIPYTSR